MDVINTLITGLKAKGFGKEVLDQSAEAGMSEMLEANAEAIGKFIADNRWLLVPMNVLKTLPNAARIPFITATAEFFAKNPFINPLVGSSIASFMRAFAHSNREILESKALSGEQVADRLEKAWVASNERKLVEVDQLYATGSNPLALIHLTNCKCGAPDDHHDVPLTALEAHRLWQHSKQLCRLGFGMAGTIPAPAPKVETETASAPVSTPSLTDGVANKRHARALAMLGEVAELHKRDILTGTTSARSTWRLADVGALKHPELFSLLPRYKKDDFERFTAQAATLKRLFGTDGFRDNAEYQAAHAAAVRIEADFKPYLAAASRVGAAEPPTQIGDRLEDRVEAGFVKVRDLMDDNFSPEANERIRGLLNIDRLLMWLLGAGLVLLVPFGLAAFIGVMDGIWHLILSWQYYGNIDDLSYTFQDFRLTFLLMFATVVILILDVRPTFPIAGSIMSFFSAAMRGAREFVLQDGVSNRAAMMIADAMKAAGVTTAEIKIISDKDSDGYSPPLNPAAHLSVVITTIACVNAAVMSASGMARFGTQILLASGFLFSLIGIVVGLNDLSRHRIKNRTRERQAEALVNGGTGLLIGAIGAAAAMFVSIYLTNEFQHWGVATGAPPNFSSAVSGIVITACSLIGFMVTMNMFGNLMKGDQPKDTPAATGTSGGAKSPLFWLTHPLLMVAVAVLGLGWFGAKYYLHNEVKDFVDSHREVAIEQKLDAPPAPPTQHRQPGQVPPWLAKKK